MLDTRQLDTLAAVVEHGSLSAAAQSLHITLAAVSLRIKSLESTLGQRLLVRGKKVRPTPAGQSLLAHARQVRLMEDDLLAGLQSQGPTPWRTLSVAINADSVASWFLPGVSDTLMQHQWLLDIVIDDQDHTHDALKSGQVMGCVTTLAKPMRGCLSESLGVMRYHCVASPALAQACRSGDGQTSFHQLMKLPAVIFNRKDALQDVFLQQYFGLLQPSYPRHFAPDVTAFEAALNLGMGWGMVPQPHLKPMGYKPPWVELFPGATVDVALYWQHWEHEPPSAKRLSEAVKAAARRYLIQA